MCNAWNHPANCACGWGGLGHVGQSASRQPSLFYFWPAGVPPISATFTSFTIPNASCPVCGESVFYYCNSYGSSVFFDELGPPWPKHPCTDNSNRSIPKSLPSIQGNENQSPAAKWQRDGWELFQIISITEIDKKTFSLQLLSSKEMQTLTLYTLRKALTDSTGCMSVLPENLGIFTTKVATGKYRVSALTENLKAIYFEAHDSRIGLHDSSKLEKSNYTKNKPLRKAIPQKNKKPTTNTLTTSMSLAFEKASIKNSKTPSIE